MLCVKGILFGKMEKLAGIDGEVCNRLSKKAMLREPRNAG
jgi:hypothetical protein